MENESRTNVKNKNYLIIILITIMIIAVIGAFMFGKNIGSEKQFNTSNDNIGKENNNNQENDNNQQNNREENNESTKIPEYDKYYFESYLKTFHVFNHTNTIKEINTDVINSTIRGLVYLEYKSDYETAPNGYNKVSVSKVDVNQLLKKYFNLENYTLKPNNIESGFATVNEDEYNYIITWPSSGMGLAATEEVIQATYNNDEVNVKFAVYCTFWNNSPDKKIIGEETVTLKYIDSNFVIQKVTYEELEDDSLCQSF